MAVVADDTCPGCAIRCSQKEFRGLPAFVKREIALNCRHDGLGVTFHAPEFLFRLISYRARVTCADWVQKHQVSMLQQTVGVGFRLIRRPRALVVAWEKTFGAQ